MIAAVAGATKTSAAKNRKDIERHPVTQEAQVLGGAIGLRQAVRRRRPTALRKASCANWTRSLVRLLVDLLPREHALGLIALDDLGASTLDLFRRGAIGGPLRNEILVGHRGRALDWVAQDFPDIADGAARRSKHHIKNDQIEI